MIWKTGGGKSDAWAEEEVVVVVAHSYN